MPHRRLVKIGEPPKLPTISQFLTEMAARQHEEIQRLKDEALAGKLPDPTVPEEHHEELTPDPWQLHPVRAKKSASKKAPSKKSAKVTKRAKKPLAKKAAKARKSTTSGLKTKAKKSVRKTTARRSKR